MDDVGRRDAEVCQAWQHSRFGYRPRTWWCDPSWVAVRLARASWSSHASGKGLQARFFTQLNSIITGADIEPTSTAGAGLLITFPLGVSLWLKAGRDLSLQPWAGSGSNMSEATGAQSVMAGDRVTLEGFTGVMGNIMLGDGVTVAPGSGALKSCPPGKVMDSKQRLQLGQAGAKVRADHSAEPDRCQCNQTGLRGALRNWKCDLARLQEASRRFSKGEHVPGTLSVALLNQNIALLIHRLAHGLYAKGWKAPARLLSSINRYVFKLTIPPQTCLGPGIWLPHLAGAVIRGSCGKDMTAFAAAWVGSANGPFGDHVHHPIVGDNVLIAGHAGVFDNAVIETGASISRKTNLHDVLAGDKVAVALTSVCTPVEKFELDQREILPFSLPTPAITADADRAARRSYEHRWGPLPLQSRLAVWLFRKSQRAWHDGRKRASRYWWLANAYLTGANLTARSAIAPGLVLVCPAGINFDGAAGAGLTLVGQCFVGGMLTADRTLSDIRFTPRIGEDVLIQPHVTIYGGCEIGDGCVCEPGSIVRERIAENSTVRSSVIRLLARRLG